MRYRHHTDGARRLLNPIQGVKIGGAQRSGRLSPLVRPRGNAAAPYTPFPVRRRRTSVAHVNCMLPSSIRGTGGTVLCEPIFGWPVVFTPHLIPPALGRQAGLPVLRGVIREPSLHMNPQFRTEKQQHAEA
jgi:hypothetical protein